ncbi:SDR family oxidoreductase [Cohnella abietis]|uniref:NAD(P)-dependent oxidoreductase n=1 Tax=Cohnella abietis TaxID=2507935 RepID=A0A3T1DE66_9BACL|nr:NmrA family NAD(P)-binding protein [Cohnella abietis]BBI36451.1 NAD(P)-dependent oxidoreductase [Cohnella abietis]
MATTDKILVYGASGVQGGAVARKLLAEGHSIQAITRNKESADQLAQQGISVLLGDLNDPASLAQAHEGVNKVLLLLPVDYHLERVRLYIRNVVDAAKNANIALLVVNTSLYVPDQITDVVAIEIKRELIEYLKQSGIPTIIVQPTLYFENFYIPGVLNNKVLAYPVPADQAIPWISIQDTADYAVYALNHPELAGQTLQVTGPEALTGNQLAERFGQSLNQDIQFFSLPVETFEEGIRPLLGEETAAGLAGLYHWIAVNSASLPKPEHIHPALRTAVQGTSLKQWVDRAIENGFFAEGGNTQQ